MTISKTNVRPARWVFALFALVTGLLQSNIANASPVSVFGAFGEYRGAVANGPYGGREWQTYVNGYVGPAEPLPGLEDYFLSAPDPNDPSSLGTGLGRAIVPLYDTPSVEFSTTSYDSNTDTWYYDPTNYLAFLPGPAADVNAGDEFLLGTFVLTNGVFWAASPFHDFTFQITTYSLNPTLDGHVFSDTLRLNITPNCMSQACLDIGWTAEDNADYFYFLGNSDLGTMSVYEAEDSPSPLGNYGSVDVYGKIGSLTPTRFANATGGVFIGPAVVTPEPSTWMLLGSGLIGILFLKRKAA